MANRGDNEARANRPACAACKYQRKSCKRDCVLSPHFPASRAKEFSAIYDLFGLKNLSKMLREVEFHEREEVVKSLYWEASMWTKDPVHGPHGAFQNLENEVKTYRHIQSLQQRSNINQEINNGLMIPGRISNTNFFQGNMNSGYGSSGGGLQLPGYQNSHVVNDQRISLQEAQSRFMINQQAGCRTAGTTSYFSPNLMVQINNNNSLAADQSIGNGQQWSRGQVDASGSNGLNAANQGLNVTGRRRDQQNYMYSHHYNNSLPDEPEQKYATKDASML